MQIDRNLALGSYLVVGAGLANAADQTILGNSFLSKNPGTADQRKLVAKAKEKQSPNTIVGNPTSSGGTLTVTENGGTPTVGVYNLPAGTSSITGKPFW